MVRGGHEATASACTVSVRARCGSSLLLGKRRRMSATERFQVYPFQPDSRKQVSLMNLSVADLPADIRRLIKDGQAIPAHPLALTAERKLDPRRQRALTRYYIDAGAGGLAVGVHTTQFAIREAGLYRPVLELARRSAEAWTDRPLVMIAGLARANRASRA